LQHNGNQHVVGCLVFIIACRLLAADGYAVDYLRVPVTDEKAPKADDFAVLIGRAWAPPQGAALVFNCQMGRGRTTTGMIIASLLHVQAMSRPDSSSGAPDAPACFHGDIHCDGH
jgi:Inositol hexakisphosphate